MNTRPWASHARSALAAGGFALVLAALALPALTMLTLGGADVAFIMGDRGKMRSIAEAAALAGAASVVMVSAMSEVLIATWPRASLDAHSLLWPQMLSNLNGIIAQRLREAEEGVASLALHSVRARVMHRLVRLAREVSPQAREQELRKWLQERIDAEDKRLARLAERIVNAMRGFKC